MGAPIAGGLLVQGRFPLDDKYWANTVSELDNGLTYIGQIRFTKDTEQPYIKRTPGWSLLVPPSTGGGGSSITISELLNYPITQGGEQLIRLPSPASKIILVLNIEQGLDVRNIVDYSINVRGDLIIKEEAAVKAGDFITCIYTTGTSSGGGTDPGDTGETSAKFVEIQEQIDDTYYRLNVLNNRVDTIAQGGSIVAPSDRWIPTTRWLDETVINEDNYIIYCDNILFRRKAANQYEKVRLDDNRVDMSLYLMADDFTDNYSRYVDFLKYLKLAAYKEFTITQVFTGNYYISKSILVEGLRLKWKGDGQVRFGNNKNGFFIKKADRDYYEFNGKLRITSTSDNEGDNSLVDPRGTKFTSYLAASNIPTNIVNFYTGQTLQQLIDSTPAMGMIPSLDPIDYTCGIISTAVVKIKNITVDGFGNGIFIYAPNITDKTATYPKDGTLLSASGVDGSMSIIDSVHVAGNRAYGIAIFGNDANQVRIINCDARSNGMWGLYDSSQSGCHWLFNHTAVNTWGGYCIISNGDPTVIGGYQEVDALTTNIFASGTVLGGPLNSRYIGAAFVLRKNVINAIQVGIVKTNKIVTSGTPDNQGTVLELVNNPSNANRVNQKANLGTTKEIYGVIDANEASATGRQVQRRTYSAAASTKDSPIDFLRQGVNTLISYTYPFTIPDRVLFKKGDIIQLDGSLLAPNIPIRLQCVSGGVVADITHLDLDGPVVSIVNNQRISYNRKTSLFQDGDIIIINGQSTNIGNLAYVEFSDTKESVAASTSQLTNLTSPATITFPKPIFRALSDNNPYGTTAERPTLGVNDKYFKYSDTTIGKEIRWDGNKWIDAMGTTV